jgi:hypothetical protein
MDLDLMIARAKVNLRKDLCSNQLIEQEISAGNGYLFFTVTALSGR